MAEEMMFESVPWESEDAEYSESDDAIVEAEDSSEDIGERTRRRRRGYRPVRGFRGIAVPDQAGRVRKVAFPAPLATAVETNRGLASQELARRALDERLGRLETRLRAQQKNDVAAAAVVALLIGGGLSAWGAYEASKKSTGSLLGRWANENATKMAAVTSVSQIATSGAKLAISGYHRNPFGVAADAFSAAQLAAFALGSLYQPRQVTGGFADLDALRAALRNLRVDHRYVLDSGEEYDTFMDDTGTLRIRRVAA